MTKKIPIEERFWRRVNKDGPLPSAEAVAVHPDIAGTPCWIWTTPCTIYGYGSFGMEHKCYLAHRVAWFLTYGKWPTPCALHKCDNHPCVRPSHLFEGTKKENSQDMVAKERCGRLTSKQVRQIRKLGLQGKARRDLAKRFGVSRSTVKQIMRNIVWRNV